LLEIAEGAVNNAAGIQLEAKFKMAKRKIPTISREEDPLWYKDAIIYEVHVKTFADSNGDGIGDFKGLTEKLDYLQDLGVTALWLLPFYPSPLRDDGYDIADYYSIHPDYGNIKDFRRFLEEAHKRGLKVITELVINHTSDQHPWFQRARRAKPGAPARDFYVWSDTGKEYSETRIIFKDFETSNWAWDPIANAYYWHRFYTHQPDLNYDNPAVHDAVFEAMDFWFDMGVDGMRLDAIPYLYEREETSNENLPEGHDFLKKLRKHLDEKYHAKMLLAEANQWPEDSVEYFGDGDECHMSFHFPVMPRLFMALHMEDRYPIIDILQQTPEIPENSQWAIFLRNHDELTLEMVTDEERDYMYRIYASDPRMRINLGIRRRLAPLLHNNRRRVELMNGLLFALPGTPVIYYGDEIGMGDNIYIGDRNGVRTPMQWSGDRNAGFSRANPQKLYLPVNIDPEYHYESVNVEAQRGNMQSLFWWMKRVITLRKQYKAFGRGEVRFLEPENSRILAFIREYEDECILVVANLSRFVQPVELGLSEFSGVTPVEMFGHTEFPPIGDLPYFLTLGPHAFYWFSLDKREAPEASEQAGQVVTLKGEWHEVAQTGERSVLKKALLQFMRARKWYLSAGRRVKELQILDSIPVGQNGKKNRAVLLLVKLEYTQGEPETYVIPISHAVGDHATYVERDLPNQVIARTQRANESGILFDALADRDSCQRAEGRNGSVSGVQRPDFRKLRGRGKGSLEPSLYRSDRSNTSVNFQDVLMLKLIRRLEPGPNPEMEIGEVLALHEGRKSLAQLAGALEYETSSGEHMTMAVLHGYVENQGDAWDLALHQLEQYLESVFLEQPERKGTRLPRKTAFQLSQSEIPQEALDMVGAFAEMARLVGCRTGEMHVALASAVDNPAFAPEPFSPFYQRSLYQSMRNRASGGLILLRKRLDKLPREAKKLAKKVLDTEKEIFPKLRLVSDLKMNAQRIRVHGNLTLSEVLWTGRDFVFIDFEGDPTRALSERRIKRSPLRDVASILRSLDHAANACFQRLVSSELIPAAEHPAAQSWLRLWLVWTSAVFLNAYLGVDGVRQLLPDNEEKLEALLDGFLMERAFREVEERLDVSPESAVPSLQTVLRIMGKE
jgi:maltose alpha-D-glucosyltransferase/alpha-amylase